MERWGHGERKNRVWERIVLVFRIFYVFVINFYMLLWLLGLIVIF